MADRTTGKKNLKRLLLIAAVVLVVLLLVVAVLLPHLLKRYIETNSETWIGRKVTIDRIVLNPFTFRYGVTGVTCYEPGSAVVFVSWKSISVRSNLWNGFQENSWRFTGLRVEQPYFHVVQTGDRFNFSDLLEMGADGPSAEADSAHPVRFSMEDVRLMGGRIVYTSDVLKDPLTIEQLDATCSLISSEQARMDFLLGFDLKSGGRLDGGFILDTEQAQYGIDARLRRFNLVQLLSYVQEFFDCRTFQGELDVDLAMLDSYRDTTSLAISAGVALRKVAFTDPNNERLFELKSGRARLDTLRAKEQRVEMGAVELDGAALRFVMLADGSDNWTRLMKLDTLSTTADATLTGPHASESNVLMILADYLGYLGRQVVANEYSAERLALLNSTVLFEDHAPSQPLRYALSEINVSVDPVNSVNPIGAITATATLQETGTLNAKATFDPKNIRNVQVDMTVDQLALNHLDPYGRWYAAHPLEDGLMHFVTRTVVTDGRLDSQNHLRVDKLKVGKKVDDHDPEIHVLPLRLAAGLLKDVNGVVELNVPVKGDLKDPKFKVWPIVWQIFKDLLVKAATAPGRLLMRAIQGVDEEDLERVRFNLMQAAPDKTQEKTLRQLAKALKTKPELHVALITLVDHEQEVQEVAIYHAKKEFLFPEKERIDGADSARIEVLSTRDSLFTGYVNGRTANMEGRSLHERCTALVGVATANAVAAEIEAARKEHVMQLLLAEGVPATRAAFREGTAAELAGQRGVPGYRFVYALEE